ncbi:MAG TPA: MFS transporter [Polyangiaceae bacterium]
MALSSIATRLFDVRAGEGRRKVAGFAALLLLVIGAHTILETARDALLLTGPGAKALGVVYIAIAAFTLPAATLAARAGERLGQRRTLGVILAVAVLGPVLLFAIPTSPAAAMSTYVLSGVLSSIIVPQFWTLVGTALTLSEGRRLFGLISAGGIVGAVLGSTAASATLLVLPVKGLLLVSSFVFVLAIVALVTLKVVERAQSTGPARRIPIAASLRAFREQPFLARVALVVFLSTATFLALDYLFKSTVARAMPGARVGPFVAHYYLALNCASLVVQLLVTGPVIRRLGVLPALVLTPFLLALSAVGSFVAGGALAGVLLIKGLDGSLRYSIHRVTSELMYLPVPTSARLRTKPLIDGALARTAQTVTGAGLLALGGTSLLAPRPLAAIVAALGCAWLATVWTMRRPYLRLLRNAVTAGSLDASDSPEPLDLETAQMLVQRLASNDALEVEGAMSALSRRGRAGFVPALVLLHRDEGVLVQALEIFGASSRSDWFAPARRLLDDPRETVRMAAARALARHAQLDPSLLANDVGRRMRGYAAVRLATEDRTTEVVDHAAIKHILAKDDEAGESGRLGMLAAIADAAPTPRLWPLLRRIVREPRRSGERSELVAKAASRQQDRTLVPLLVSLLSEREGREDVRTALSTFGDLAFAEVWRTLRDPSRDRRLRLHMAKTLVRFGTKRAADCLLEEIETERDRRAGSKAIRALVVLVTNRRIFVDRGRTERLCCSHLEQHFRYLVLRAVFEGAALPASVATTDLLLELLHEKASQALARAFQLLQIAHPRQGVHHAYLASRSDDPYARANAAELLDAFLRRRDQQRLRALFRLATDDLSPAERVERARSAVPRVARTREEAVAALLGGQDAMLVALGQRAQAPPEPAPLPSMAPPACAS